MRGVSVGSELIFFSSSLNMQLKSIYFGHKDAGTKSPNALPF